MDISINALGMQQLQMSNPFSPAMAPLLNSGGGFEDVLRRVQNSGQGSGISGRQAENADGIIPPRNPNIPAIVRDLELYEVCMELETLLIKNLISSMRNTIQKSNLIDTGFAGEVYEDMLYDEYAKVYARNANLGFAEMAYRDLTRYS